MFIVTSEREAAFLLKTVKRMLYLGYVLFRCVLIYNLKVSFNFRLLFLLLNVIKMLQELTEDHSHLYLCNYEMSNHLITYYKLG